MKLLCDCARFTILSSVFGGCFVFFEEWSDILVMLILGRVGLKLVG